MSLVDIFNILTLHFDLPQLIETVGYIGLFGIVFAESGLIFAMFLPGESLLFTAGVLSAQGYLNIWILIVIFPIAAILGDTVGYWFGSWIGPSLFSRPDSRFFKQEYLTRTREFYEKHGPRAIVLARFIPIVRTLTPIIAGIAEMKYATFLRYNIIGGVVWGVGVPLIGYFFGQIIPNSERYLFPIVIVIIIVSILPGVYEVYKAHRASKNRA
jgi:membrane-associated protein